MNDVKLEFTDEIIEFGIEQYNQLVSLNHRLFLKTMIRLKNLEGEKFDDHYNEIYKGNSYLYNQKLTSKNIFVLDLNDFSKLILNLSFHKSSIIKKSFHKDLNEFLNEDNVYLKIIDLMKEFDINDEVTLNYKDIGFDKIFDTFYSGQISADYIDNTDIITKLIIDYLDKYEIPNAFIIVDSSIKFFDLEPLIKDERIIILDTNVQFNTNTSNLILFGDTVESYAINDLSEKIEFMWPSEISQEKIMSLLQVYLHMVLNDEINILTHPSDNLICLYIIVRKMLSLKVNIDSKINIRFHSDLLKSFIEENMI